MFSFFKSSRPAVHFAIVGVLAIILVLIILKMINIFTRHGQSIAIPNFTGLYYNELDKNEEFSKFVFTIADSIYDPTKEKGTIISQDPAPGSRVKSGRQVYITVVSINPEQVAMPNLVDLTLRNATSLLETYGLKAGRLSYVPDIAKNAVIEQKFKGQNIAVGKMINKGSTIDLVLGLGENGDRISIPFLIGMKRSEAVTKIRSSSLNVGLEHFDPGDDTSKVRIYRQSPNHSSEKIANFGAPIELWYKSDKNFDFDTHLKNINKDSL